MTVWTLGKLLAFPEWCLVRLWKPQNMSHLGEMPESRPDVLGSSFSLARCSTLAEFRGETRRWAE